MRKLLWLVPLALSAADISPKAYVDHVRYLASPELKGRATGTPELEKAANYIAAQFKSFGLKPIPGAPGYELPFPGNDQRATGRQQPLSISRRRNDCGAAIVTCGRPRFHPLQLFVDWKVRGPGGLRRLRSHDPRVRTATTITKESTSRTKSS
jgi:hypothetical protein